MAEKTILKIDAKQLKQTLNFEGDIQDDEKILEDFSHDASFFEIKPEFVAYPKTILDIQRIVSFAAAQKQAGQNISITARSAGTDMSGGPLSQSIILEFTKYFNHIGMVSSEAGETEPGVFYRDFEKETLKYGALVPSYPASRELCTVGGMVANNSGGEKTLAYGKTEDYILELHCVLSDGSECVFKPLNEQELQEKMRLQNFEGEIYRKIHKLISENEEALLAAKPKVSKNSAGYYLWNVRDKTSGIFNLNKLIAGSQGTLAIITKIKFRLVPQTKNSKLVTIFLKDLSNLAEIVNVVLPYKPESFESYDDNTLKMAMKFLPDIFKLMKENIFRLAIQFLPEFEMLLSGGMPKLVLMAEFTGNDEAEIDARIAKVTEALKKFRVPVHVTKNEEETKKYWTIRRESFNLLRHHIKGKRTAPFIDDIIVRPEHLPEFLPQLNAILNQYNIIYTIAGHVGDGNFHIIPLMDFKDAHTAQIIPELSKKVYDLVLQYHGSITAEHNDGLVRSPYLKQMYGEKIYALFEETKRIFDPLDILNPGKKVGSSLEFSLKHIVKTS